MARRKSGNPESHLGERLSAIRMWFEFLRLARNSSDPKVKSALVVSQPKYKPWDMDNTTRFDAWFKAHGHLFEEKYFVRELKLGELPKDPNALLLEIPLTLSPTELTRRIKPLIKRAFEARAKLQKKSKAAHTATYRLTEGSEPKLDAIREMLTVYRDVYLKNPKLRGKALLTAVHKLYTGRKNKRWAVIPKQLDIDKYGNDDIQAMRNLRRYLQKAEMIVLNVARGEFPGSY